MNISTLTAAGFIGFYSLYTRAFTSFTEIPIRYRMVLAGSCLVSLLIIALVFPKARKHLPALSIAAGVLMAVAFYLQKTLFSATDITWPQGTVIISSLLMGAGFALYWTLWIYALSHRPPALVLRCIAAGTTFGVIAAGIPSLLPSGLLDRSSAFSATRYALLLLSTACLFKELSSSQVRISETGYPKNQELVSKTIAQRYVVLPALVYLIAWFTLYAGRYHRESNATVGLWVLLASSLAICILLTVLGRYENESLQFVDLLGDVLLFLGLSLDLLFVASSESDELFWTGSLFSNCLIDIVIMAKMASLRYYCGISPERVACLVLATRELALLLGMGANRMVDPHVMAIANTLLVSISLIGAAVFIALKTYAVIQEKVSESNRAARAFARDQKDARGLTEREAEVLEELLEGTSYRAVAELMCISESTVKTHVTHLYKKLEVDGRDTLIGLYKEYRRDRTAS